VSWKPANKTGPRHPDNVPLPPRFLAAEPDGIQHPRSSCIFEVERLPTGAEREIQIGFGIEDKPGLEWLCWARMTNLSWQDRQSRMQPEIFTGWVL